MVGDYTRKDMVEAQQVINSTIRNCEKMQPKFAVGTAQHTLLKNRIKALNISKAFLADDDVTYTKEELVEALPPVTSIIHKCEKSQLKFLEGTAHHTRLKNIIKSMNISKSLIIDEISKRD
jgi:hypothetical protein